MSDLPNNPNLDTEAVKELPDEVSEILEIFVAGLRDNLGDKLYGVYLYGASVFPGTSALQDIDCHVINKEALSEKERRDCLAQYKSLAQAYPGYGEKLDAYMILLQDAKQREIPQHQVLTEVFDHAWALHCAHIRAGYYRVIWGPEPVEIFPAPTWAAIDRALAFELAYVKEHVQYQAYGILNLCRILYSYKTRNPAVSKKFSGHWGIQTYPQWEGLIQAALRFYEKTHTQDDTRLLENDFNPFLSFMVDRIEIYR